MRHSKSYNITIQFYYIMRYIILFLLFVKLNVAFGQSKKEQIAILIIERDSLINLLSNIQKETIVLNKNLGELKSTFQKEKGEKEKATKALKKEIYNLKFTLDTLNIENEINLGPLNSIPFFYKSYHSNDEYFRLIIIKDSVYDYNNKRFVNNIQLFLNDKELNFNKDSMGNLIPIGWQGLKYKNDKSIMLRFNCNDIILEPNNQSLTWQANLIYNEGKVKTCDTCAFEVNDEGEFYKYSNNISLITQINELPFLASLLKSINLNYLERETAYDLTEIKSRIYYYGHGFITIEYFYDNETFDGGILAPPEILHYSFDIEGQKLLLMRDLFAPHNIDRLKKILKAELIRKYKQLSDYEIEDELEFAIKENGLVFIFNTRWELSWSESDTQIYLPYSTLEKFMLDNDVTKKLLNKY